MIKYIKNSFLFLLIGFFIFGGLFFVGKTNFKKYEKFEKRIIRIIKTKRKATLVFGSSHASSIRLELLGLKPGWNLAGAGADLFEVDYEVRTLVSKMKNIKTVFISMSYFSFLYDNAAYIDENGQYSRAEKRSELYAIYPSWRFIKGDFKNYIFGKLYPIFTEDHWETVFTNLFGNKRIKKKKRRRPKKELDIIAKIELLNRAENRQGKNGIADTKIEIMKQNHPDLEKHTYKLLTDLIVHLKENNIRIIFFTPPYWKAYNDSYPLRYKEVMYNNMDKILKQFNVEYYNFSESEFFQKRPELFHNSDHLNKEGFAVFNPMLKAAMNNNLSGINVLHNVN